MLRSPLSSPLRSPLSSPLAARRGGGVSDAMLTAEVQALFAAYSASGVMYDFLSNGTLYQDSAATVPVSSPSDPIGYAVDLSGNGVPFIPASTEQRPLWVDGASFDGVNHWCVVQFGPASPSVGPSFMGARNNYTSGVSYAGLVSQGQSPNATELRIYSTTGVQYGNGRTRLGPANQTVGLKTVTIENAGGAADALCNVDGVDSVITNADGGLNHTQKRFASFGCQTVAGGNRALMVLKRYFIINAALNADEKSLVREWLGKMG